MYPYLTLGTLYLFTALLPLSFEVGRNFEYEYTFLVSLFSLLIIPLFGIFLPRMWLRQRYYAYLINFRFEMLWIFIIAPAILFLPGFIAFNFGLCPCSYNEFNFWMLLQAYPSFILAHACMHVALRLRHLKFPRWKIFFGGLAIFLALLLGVFFAFWFQPQVRLVDLLVGFIHGPIYDNWIPVDNGLIFARSAHLFIAFSMLMAAWYQPHKKMLFGGLLSFGLLGYMTCAIAAQQFPSVTSGKGQLDAMLPDTIEEKNFTIHFQNTKTDKTIPHTMQQIAIEANFHYAELAKLFAPDLPHVHIYVYPDASTKKQWFGAGATDVTDVHTPSIHINSALFPHPTLRHELVHAIASERAYHGLGFHPNLAFTEGMAVALAPEEDELGLHAGAAALLKSKRLPKITHLFSLFFWTKAGARAYTASGSLVDFLIKTYGIQPVKKLYEGESWESVIKEPRSVLLKKWRDFILQNYDENQHKLYAESLFRYPGVLRSLCPHSKALLVKSRKGRPVLRLRQPIGWDPEKDYWQWRVDIDDQDRYARLEYWRDEIKQLNRNRMVEKQRLQVWQKALAQAVFWPPQTTEDIEMKILQADLERALQGRAKSLQSLEEIVELAKTKGIGDSLIRQVQVRLEIEKQLDEVQSLQWIKFLAGWREKIPDKMANMDEPWIFTYLRIRNGDKIAIDINYLLAAIQKPVPEQLANTFKIEWFKYIGHRAMQLNAFAIAEQSYALAVKFSVPGSREHFQVLERAARFFSTAELSAQDVH